MKPTIGITPSLSVDNLAHGTFERYVIASHYPNAILSAGGIPILLPPQEDNVSLLLDRVDGILLSGGADIDPTLFGEREIHPETYGISPLRDGFEFALLAEALKRDLPILCICRGIQVLNVGLGGTLIQDVPDQIGREIYHRQQELGIAAEEPSHRVEVVEGSLLHRVYGRGPITSNSFHHQAIRDVALDLVVDGRTADGLVEAVTHPGKSFVLGVQWHPELMFARHQEHLAPFQQLTIAAESRQLAGATL